MRYLPLGFLLRAYAAALCCASWIVPDEEREEWLKEWKAELWHVVHQNGKSKDYSVKLGTQPQPSPVPKSGCATQSP